MPLRFDCNQMLQYEDRERRLRRMPKRTYFFVAIWVAFALAVAADRLMGLDIGIDRVVAPLQSI